MVFGVTGETSRDLPKDVRNARQKACIFFNQLIYFFGFENKRWEQAELVYVMQLQLVIRDFGILKQLIVSKIANAPESWVHFFWCNGSD